MSLINLGPCPSSKVVCGIDEGVPTSPHNKSVSFRSFLIFPFRLVSLEARHGDNAGEQTMVKRSRGAKRMQTLRLLTNAFEL